MDNTFPPRLEGALEAITQSHSVLKTFFDNAPHMMGIVEIVEDDILHVADNLVTARFFGLDPEILYGSTESSLGVGAAEIKLWVDKYLESEKTGQPVSFEYTHPSDDGLKWLSATVSFAGRPPDGNPRFCYVVEDITKRKEAEQAIAYARDAALEVSDLKSEFLATVSHEIRTPLSGVIGITELLLDTPLDVEQIDLANTILSSGQDLLSIINDILDFSKIEAGEFILDSRDFELSRVITEVKHVMANKAREKGLEFISLLNPELPLILIGDPGRLKQILFNLISNAIKFSDKGEVQVQVELVELKEQAAQLKFIVKDNGIGLSAKAKKRLFQPLTQADGSHTRRFGGTGLGLAISKKLVNLMQGEIGVESEEGEGSIFWFTVPFRIPVGHEPLRITPKPPLKLKPGKLILMVEDETVMRELTTLQLEKLGYRIIGAANGRAGVEAFQKEKFDLIIMDCQMPVMSGFAATRIIRELESQNNSHIPIIALTANAFESDLEKCLEAGMDAYLIKPTSLEKLATALYDLLT